MNAPKPASVEDAPDKDGPAKTSIDVPVAEETTPVADKSAAQNGASTETDAAAAPAVDAVDGDDKIVTEKPAAVNGSAKDVQMTGAIDGAPPQDGAPATATDANDMAVKPPAPAVQAPAVQAPVDEKPQEETAPAVEKPQKTETDKKRKADVLEADDAVPEGGPVGGAEQPPKRKPGRPPSKSNGDANGDEGLGHKLVKKAKKVLPVGKTERKTRSQGPA